MPGILRLAPLEDEKARSARESSTGAVRPNKMTDRLKRTKNINERPKQGDPSVEESRRRRQRPPVTSSLGRTMETHKHCSESAAARHQQNSDKSKSDTGTGTRAPKRNLRTASYQTQTAMPSRDRSLAALAALHSSYKSASSLVLESNDPSISASAADDMAIGSLQDKLMALAGRGTTNTNNTKEQQRRIRSNSLDSGRDESLTGVSARKPRAMAQAARSTSRRDLQRQILEDMRAKHQSARMRRMEPIGSRRALVQPGSNRGIRYKAPSSLSSNGSPKPSRRRTSSPRPAKNTNENLRKKEKKKVPKPTKKNIESRVYFAPNDVDGAYQRLGWDTGATFQPRTEDRRYPPVTTSALKRPARSSSVSDSLASGDTHSLTLGESSVDNSSVVAVESGAVSNQRKTSLPKLPGSLLVPFPSSRSDNDDDGSESPTSSLFESAEPTKLPPRSSIRAKMAAERANIPERISEENSDDCQEESMKSSPTTNTSFASSRTRHYASDRTLPCSNLDKACTLKEPSNSSSGKDDSLMCSIPSQSSSELDYVSRSKYRPPPSQDDIYEDSSEDEDDDFFGGDESNNILAISLSLADVASDSFRVKTNSIQKSPSAVSEKSKTSSLSTKSSDIHLHRQRNGNHASTTVISEPVTRKTCDDRAFVVQGRGIEPGAAPTQDSSNALFIIEDPESLLPAGSQQGGANISDRAIFNRYWEKASPKHHASNSGKDLLQVSRRHSLGEDTESSDSAAPPPPPVWAKMEARHSGTSKNSPPIHIGIIEQDGTPLPDVPRRNIQRASMA